LFFFSVHFDTFVFTRVRFYWIVLQAFAQVRRPTDQLSNAEYDFMWTTLSRKLDGSIEPARNNKYEKWALAETVRDVLFRERYIFDTERVSSARTHQTIHTFDTFGTDEAEIRHGLQDASGRTVSMIMGFECRRWPWSRVSPPYSNCSVNIIAFVWLPRVLSCRCRRRRRTWSTFRRRRSSTTCANYRNRRSARSHVFSCSR